MSTEKAIEIIIEHYEAKLKRIYEGNDTQLYEATDRENVIFNFINEKLGYENGVLAVAKLVDAMPDVKCKGYVDWVESEDWAKRRK